MGTQCIKHFYYCKSVKILITCQRALNNVSETLPLTPEIMFAAPPLGCFHVLVPECHVTDIST